MRNVALIILYALTIVVAVIAVRIETLNATAGNYLPRTNPNDTGKWRESPVSEHFWRLTHTRRNPDGEAISRDLTVTEQAQMKVDLDRAKANNRLYHWVGTAGLLQYILLPTLIIAAANALAARPSRRRLLAFTPIGLVVLFATASLWYRQYLSSLGW